MRLTGLVIIAGAALGALRGGAMRPVPHARSGPGVQSTVPDTLPVVRTATGHAMRYWLSLPAGWVPGREWPVVVTLDGGGKDWQRNAVGFARVRNARGYPFILVTPEILTNGGRDLRAMPMYHYAGATWDEVARSGRCAFDLAGLDSVLADVRRLYGGEAKYFVTGWSAGGHLAWALVFRQPERLRAAVLSGANFTGRCITVEVPRPVSISRAAERVALPVRLLAGSADRMLASPQPLEAMALARSAGYGNVSFDTIPRMPHSPLPEQVLGFFAEVLRGGDGSSGRRSVEGR